MLQKKHSVTVALLVWKYIFQQVFSELVAYIKNNETKSHWLNP